ncbi:hypothetical protein TWF106_010439 [Orbilia oligospora]|uniref:Uncharacterized protein n=1 Tax=Orbilia oligospora TaxID=2813651 RepID=A0A6G1M859_ORBOL|nr:hypothetical protein TWF788_006546 [Orbilia oligospora]KAF3207689.1 hypothetical protein TWF679_008256 [Orbilia oligospora]KAF3210780.1 hypothetical protein TWF106_010439 [Orbilia oligospora]KAF3213558.1 hypothetical protein TWF191_010032 [Orbilia oligospora]KAF3249455.1 hypothetical protein TWF192_005530 [Orbilia oligospora]
MFFFKDQAGALLLTYINRIQVRGRRGYDDYSILFAARISGMVSSVFMMLLSIDYQTIFDIQSGILRMIEVDRTEILEKRQDKIGVIGSTPPCHRRDERWFVRARDLMMNSGLLL